MTQSTEYPDLLWMPPASWSNANRTSVQLIVIHDTEGSEHATSAEDGASYDQRRTDGTSTHYFHDTNSTVQCVRTEDIAYAARHEGNLRGIQHELCGTAGQGKAGWADAGSTSELRLAARQCARDAKKWNIPVRHLTVAQVAGGEKGFCGHADITKAFPQDNGTHTDPGPDFPWSQFLDMVRAELEGDVALTDEDKAWITSQLKTQIGGVPKAVLAYDPGEAPGVPNVNADAVTNPTVSVGWALRDAGVSKNLGYALRDTAIPAISAKLDTLLAAVDTAATGDAARDTSLLSTLLAAIDTEASADADAVAAALVAPLAAAITEAMPPGGTDLTFEQVEQAVRNVLTHGTEGA